MLLWSILNVVLLLGFFYAWSKAVQLLWRSKHSWLAAVFVLGSLGVAGFNQVTGTSTVPQAATPGTPIHLVIHQTPSLTWSLEASYVPDSSGIRMVAGTTYVSGFVSGLSWRPGATQVFADGDTIRYLASGNLEWQLLGVPFYREAGQSFTGVVNK